MAAPPPATPSPRLARRSRSALAAGLATLVWLGAAVSPEAQTRVVWHGTEMARVDVLSGWRGADDRHVAALKITLAPGWKTYWRAPGDAGIPPTLTDSGSRNLARAWLEFPRPSVFEAGGMHIVGYEQQVILPLIVEPRRRGRDIALSMQLQFGICEDVCIPITARVSGQLSAGQETRDPVIVAALASRPMSAEQAGVSSVRCTLEAGPGAGARLVAMLDLPHLGGGEFVVFEPGNRRLWVGEALARREGRVLHATAPLRTLDGGTIQVDRSALRITVVGSQGAVDIQGCTP